MTNHEAIKVLKSWVECLTTDCDDDCEHCHIQLDGSNAVIEACAVAITELSQPDTDTISRQAVLDVIFSEPLYESGMRKRDSDDIVPAIYEKIKALPPSPSRQTEQQIHCNKCKHYQGVHGVQGHAPCSYWKSSGVLWNWYCSQAEPHRP